MKTYENFTEVEVTYKVSILIPNDTWSSKVFSDYILDNLNERVVRNSSAMSYLVGVSSVTLNCESKDKTWKN